jgi:hypothetical protein
MRSRDIAGHYRNQQVGRRWGRFTVPVRVLGPWRRRNRRSLRTSKVNATNFLHRRLCTARVCHNEHDGDHDKDGNAQRNDAPGGAVPLARSPRVTVDSNSLCHSPRLHWRHHRPRQKCAHQPMESTHLSIPDFCAGSALRHLAIAVPDVVAMLDREHQDMTVAVVSGTRRPDDRAHHLVDIIVVHDHVDLKLD